MAERSDKVSGEVIGIDLGTTFSCVAVARNGIIEIIANDQGNRTTPSSVAFSAADSERLIGDSAKNQAALNPFRTIFDVKRLIGKNFEDEEVQRDMRYLPYPVVNRDGKPYVEVDVKGKGKKSFSPEEISAMVLTKMKETAELFLGKPVVNAVVTVPAYFNDAQRKATKDAGTIAGLNVIRIINEPTAGALAYGLRNHTNMVSKKKILVYDLGGGTFDVSVLEVENDLFEVLATGGDTHLGGGDFDQRVMDYFINLIKRKYQVDISGEKKAMGKLRRECERAKRVLSSQTQVRVEIDSLIQGIDFSEPLTRAKFEELNLDLFKKTMEVVKETLVDAKIEKSEIDEIVLVGGSTRILRVREMLKQMFNGKEPSNKVNPDEAVAYGAAVLGATLTDEPTAPGVAILGSVMSVVIPRNTPIPATVCDDDYKTVHDHQTCATIEVYQGERTLVKDCIKLGSFDLSGITPAPSGVAKLEVTFDIDVDGILKVTARETTSTRSKSLVITNYKGNLTQREIERMVKDAKKMAEEDKIVKANMDARNNLERFIYDLKNTMSDGESMVASKMSLDDQRKVDRALGEASEWLDNNQNATKKDYDKKLNKLTDVWNPIITKVYMLLS
ncbi:Luminal-binding protein [Linum perenne]